MLLPTHYSIFTYPLAKTFGLKNCIIQRLFIYLQDGKQ
jgi:hypothetical protein